MKNLFLILLLVVIFCPKFIWSQHYEISSRSTSSASIEDYFGISTSCHSDLLEAADSLSQLLSPSNNTFKTYLIKSYVPSVFAKHEDGATNMEKLSKKHIADQNDSYLLFYIHFDEAGIISKIDGKLKISDDNLQGNCLGQSSALISMLNHEIENINLDILTLECDILNVVKVIRNKVQNSCEYNIKDMEPWLLDREFDLISLDGLSIKYSTNLRNDKLNSRNECGILDYTFGELKYITSNGVLQPINNLISSSIPNTLSTGVKIIITDKNDSQKLLDSIFSVEILNQTCDAVFWFHFYGKNDEGVDKLGIRSNIKSEENISSLIEEVYTFDQLKNKYKDGFFDDLFKIDFRLKNHSAEITTFFESIDSYPYNIKDQLIRVEYFAGISCGLLDGAIETIDFISLVIQSAGKFQMQSNPTSSLWWHDLMLESFQKRNFYNALIEKWDETYQSWQSIATGVDKFADAMSVPQIRNYVFEKICSVIYGMLKEGLSNIIFKSGTFLAGYTLGKLAFDLIGSVKTLSVGFAKGLAKGEKFLDDVVTKVCKDLNAADFYRAFDGAIYKLDDLLLKLKDTNILKPWFLSDTAPMPMAMKRTLVTWEQQLLKSFDSDLAHPVTNSAVKLNPEEGAIAYRLLKKNNITCH